ncbi:MAG: Thiol-disulfide oxidoreductase ResA [Candidatus Aerophobetes bacterium ADurb.Bin490]|nr:MAG: Thiol-disulfide oxidoreductase ResA [Candidatus Aerophobetes bacterium ADurb.Bin490]HNZ29577.1 TlpA disulfide reductase family protein [Candidatus Goldiibacteriota bacterium]HPI02548.1 TlpA disulfide reductase family protein [Candidatus Goldiibacteriota bacterium]HPN64669.1 TlpA disulfide reductase family protein [Candidatus Goldiibacteriota bacterium]HRQ42934.1 TlpA disulfide reductase family protein [Candidatus Goldiibacteriota bacterium]
MKVLPIILCFAVSAAVSTGCGTAGKVRPDSFSDRVNVKTLEGPLKKMSDFKGKVVFFTVWTTWCGHCTAELEKLMETYNKYKDRDFIIVAASDDDPEKVKEFIKSKNYPYYFCLADRDSLGKSGYQVIAYPTLYIIDKEGRAAACMVGALPDDTFTDYLLDR